MNKAPKAVNGQILSTVIDIRQNDPYTIISREIDGDQTNTTDKKAIELVLEVVNEETTPKNELKGNIKELQEKVESAFETIKSQKESADTLYGTIDELISVIYEQVLPNMPEKEGASE